MNISLLNMRDFEYIVAAAQTQHFGRAATQCNVSQPALSTQIKKIEEVLGVLIFERTNRKVLLTQAGAKIIRQIHVILDETKKLGEMSQIDSEPLSGTLRWGCIASLGPYLMPHLLINLKKSFPNIRPLLKEGLTDHLIYELREGSLDVVLASPTFDQTGLSEYKLFWEPFVLATPLHHPLSEKKYLSAKDLKAEDMVLLSDGHCLTDQTLDFCALNKNKSLKDFQATSLETLKHLVATGMGYTVLPILSTLDSPKLDKVLEIRELEKNIGRQISLYCRKSSTKLQDVEALVEYIKKQRIPFVHF